MTNDDTRTNQEETPEAPASGAVAGAFVRPWARLRQVQPEARLALAVLESAIDTLRATYGVEHGRARTLAADAWRWVASDDARQPFAFRWICQHLEIDAAWLRAGLARWRPRRPGTPPPLGVGSRPRGTTERAGGAARRGAAQAAQARAAAAIAATGAAMSRASVLTTGS